MVARCHDALFNHVPVFEITKLLTPLRPVIQGAEESTILSVSVLRGVVEKSRNRK